MIVCPNCLHQNPDGAANCEACYTVLPEASSCPNCGAPLQPQARFCGQCGFKLSTSPAPATATAPASSPPELDLLEPLPPAPQVLTTASEGTAEVAHMPPTPPPAAAPASPVDLALAPANGHSSQANEDPSTHLQPAVQLLHVQTNTFFELPSNLQVIHMGKPNDRIPPDIDIAPLPSAEVVSRIHADIYVDEGQFFVEDAGSANGTYINGTPLMPGHRHRLRPGDRISLGKGDLVTFLFQSK